MMITGRAGKAVGNNYRAAFKDTTLHMQGPWHSIHSSGWSPGRLLQRPLEVLVIRQSGTPAVSTWPAAACVCLDSLRFIRVVCSLCSIKCGVICDLVIPTQWKYNSNACNHVYVCCVSVCVYFDVPQLNCVFSARTTHIHLFMASAHRHILPCRSVII